MKVTWLHVSDFHIRGDGAYDRDVVLRALVKSVEEFSQHDRASNLIFATGDIAYSGKSQEYELATKFFDDLLHATGLEKSHLFVVPGNHDVDRSRAVGLLRTLELQEEADKYFCPTTPLPHLTLKQGAFLEWYNRYFEGIRALPQDSTCGPVEAVDVQGHKIGILPINDAMFCEDDNDHDKLWIGRRCLQDALNRLSNLRANVNVALMHHPLDWLHHLERSNIKARLHSDVDFILLGHLHETGVEIITSTGGTALYCAAGAAYQTRKWSNRAVYATLDMNKASLTVFPIRYEDRPTEVWTVDPSLFPSEPNYEKSFSVPRLAGCQTASTTSYPLLSSGSGHYESTALTRTVDFDYSKNNGRYVVGEDKMVFETRWTRGSDTCIHVYDDPSSIQSIALVDDVTSITDITDASKYDTSSSSLTPLLGDIVVWKNISGYYLAAKIEALQCRGYGGNRADKIRFSYVIAPNKSTSFTDST